MASSSASRSGLATVATGLPSRTISQTLGGLSEDGGLDIHHRAEAERRAVMLIQHHAVEVHQLSIGVNLLVEILIKQFQPHASRSKKRLGVLKKLRSPTI